MSQLADKKKYKCYNISSYLHSYKNSSFISLYLSHLWVHQVDINVVVIPNSFCKTRSWIPQSNQTATYLNILTSLILLLHISSVIFFLSFIRVLRFNQSHLHNQIQVKANRHFIDSKWDPYIIHSFIQISYILVYHKFTVCTIGYQYFTSTRNDPFTTHLPTAGVLTVPFLYHGPSPYLKPTHDNTQAYNQTT